MRGIVRTAASAAAFSLIAACSSTAAPSIALLALTAQDFAYAGASTIAAGTVTVELRNTGSEPHQATLLRLDPGKTLADLRTIFTAQQTEQPEWVHSSGGVAGVAPGETRRATSQLTAGTYAIVCFIPSSDGTPHVEKGMTTTLTVSESEEKAAALPQGSGTVTASEYTFALPSFRAGTATYLAVNGGKEKHEWGLLRFESGKGIEDFTRWIAALFQGQDPGRPPFGFAGGVSEMDPGARATFETTLEAGARYAFICFVADEADPDTPHFLKGMVKTFEVAV